VLHTREPVAAPDAAPSQARVQSPQWSASVEVLMHCPLQLVVPLGHDTTQLPPEQTSFAPHGSPHAPQFASLDSRLTHLPLHDDRPPLHEIVQPPPWHAAMPLAGAGQGLSHAPQWLTDFCRSTH
jgi:hypothetical protein